MLQRVETLRGVGDTEVTAYTIDNQNGLQITAIDFGATLTSVLHTAHGARDELLIGFDAVSQYQQIGSYVGATVGRVCNRIRNATIDISGERYPLTKNFGVHTLHGGATGFSYRSWNGEIVAAKSESGGNSGSGNSGSGDGGSGSSSGSAYGDDALIIRFTLHSPHLEEGFPGNLFVTADYVVTMDNRLIIEYRAHADCDTAVNLTNHAYWNLSGGGSVANHLFLVNADSYLKTDSDGICNGEMGSVEGGAGRGVEGGATGGVEGGAAGFRTLRPAIPHHETVESYDLCYHLNNSVRSDLPVNIADNTLNTAAYITTADDSRAMLVSTTYPALQFFLPADFPAPPVPSRFVPNGAFCVECMMHQDASRFPHLPTTVLPKGVEYHHTTSHQFYG